MNFVKKFIAFLQKIGVLKMGIQKKAYKGTKEKPYQIDVDPLDMN